MERTGNGRLHAILDEILEAARERGEWHHLTGGFNRNNEVVRQGFADEVQSRINKILHENDIASVPERFYDLVVRYGLYIASNAGSHIKNHFDQWYDPLLMMLYEATPDLDTTGSAASLAQTTAEITAQLWAWVEDVLQADNSPANVNTSRFSERLAIDLCSQFGITNPNAGKSRLSDSYPTYVQWLIMVFLLKQCIAALEQTDVVKGGARYAGLSYSPGVFAVFKDLLGSTSLRASSFAGFIKSVTNKDQRFYDGTLKFLRLRLSQFEYAVKDVIHQITTAVINGMQ